MELPKYDADKYMTKTEVANRFGMDLPTFIKALRRGSVDAEKLGPVIILDRGHRLYERERVYAYLRDPKTLHSAQITAEEILDEFDWFINFVSPAKALLRVCNVYGRSPMSFYRTYKDDVERLAKQKGYIFDVQDFQCMV